MDFIRPIGLFRDPELMKQSAVEIINTVGWGNGNQIGLTYRPNSANPWFDAVGSLYDRERKVFIGKESDFTQQNPLPKFLYDALQELKQHQNTAFGRIRFMRLMPHCGLSVHKDAETRYHYVLETNNKSYMCMNDMNSTGLEPRAQCFHIPMDGQWYHIDTREVHWVYNGGETPRIHIVISTLE